MYKPWNDTEIRWVCEQHPNRDFEHKIFNWCKFRFEECAGPGMPEDTPENRAKGLFGNQP